MKSSVLGQEEIQVSGFCIVQQQVLFFFRIVRGIPIIIGWYQTHYLSDWDNGRPKSLRMEISGLGQQEIQVLFYFFFGIGHWKTRMYWSIPKYVSTDDMFRS